MTVALAKALISEENVLMAAAKMTASMIPRTPVGACWISGRLHGMQESACNFALTAPGISANERVVSRIHEFTTLHGSLGKVRTMSD